MADQSQGPDSPGFRAENEIDLVLGNANPNPGRVGCPSRDVLAALARRERPAGDPLFDHLIKCSPYYREVRAMQQAVARPNLLRQSRVWWAAAAAVVMIGVGGGWYLSSRSSRAVPSGTVQQVANTAEYTARLDLREYSVVRGDEKQPDREPLTLSVGRARLTILLSRGSEPGAYEVQVLDSDLHSRASATGIAEIQNYVTTLQTALDLTSLAPGSYSLAVRRQDEDWRMYPLRLTKQ